MQGEESGPLLLFDPLWLKRTFFPALYVVPTHVTRIQPGDRTYLLVYVLEHRWNTATNFPHIKHAGTAPPSPTPNPSPALPHPLNSPLTHPPQLPSPSIPPPPSSLLRFPVRFDTPPHIQETDMYDYTLNIPTPECWFRDNRSKIRKNAKYRYPNT